tara:strand:+ start:1830 stop:2009 length:180 start_codon:yes stop_codon:yes gene_type:complete
MAIKVSNTTVIDDNRKATFQTLKSGSYTTGNEPGSPSAGDFIWDSTEGKIKFYNGTAWE